MVLNRPSRLFGLLLWLASLMCAADSAQSYAEPLRFVYIHGTNQNTPESHELFNRKVAGLHPYIMSALEQEPLVKKHLLQDGQLTISPQTIRGYPVSFLSSIHANPKYQYCL